MSTIYLLHLNTPLRHAKHYVGLADDLHARLERHANGQGARMLAVCRERGISWDLARTWEGDRSLERRLKNRKDAPQICPICSGRRALVRAVYPTLPLSQQNKQGDTE
jgi:predicted GIY-YIG superfamily endonuclease